MSSSEGCCFIVLLLTLVTLGALSKSGMVRFELRSGSPGSPGKGFCLDLWRSQPEPRAWLQIGYTS